jgi:hypothetical protein
VLYAQQAGDLAGVLAELGDVFQTEPGEVLLGKLAPDARERTEGLLYGEKECDACRGTGICESCGQGNCHVCNGTGQETWMKKGTVPHGFNILCGAGASWDAALALPDPENTRVALRSPGSTKYLVLRPDAGGWVVIMPVQEEGGRHKLLEAPDYVDIPLQAENA